MSNNEPIINKLRRVLNRDFDGFLVHVRCICLLFNSIVQKGLKHISEQIRRIRDALIYIIILPNGK